jgi:leucyl aminopeptidase
MTDVDIAGHGQDGGALAVLAVGLDDSGLHLDAISADILAPAARSTLVRFAAESDPSPRAGDLRELALPGHVPNKVLIVGVGDRSTASLRLAGAALGRAARARPLTAAVPGVADAGLQALTEGILLGAYRFEVKSRPSPSGGVRLAGIDDTAAVERGIAYARGAIWARDLANTRTSTKTPAWMAAQAERELVPLGVRVATSDVAWLTEQKFGGVLAVGSGSAVPPCLVEAAWRPTGVAAAPHLVIVGKGITFDTGGYDIKPGESMKLMYTDMAGGAAALGALRVIAALRMPIRVTVLVPLAQNSISGSAMRPSDVVRHFGGRTSEVGNTDAEGRLVLADALAYAAARLRPTVLIDVATLTGAIKVALGLGTAGYFATSDDLGAGLARAADSTGERLWRMPLADDYEAQLRSDVADATNNAGGPGAITAALYLRPFAASVPWAHLDIAGPARSAVDAGLVNQGATGFGARLLARWVESYP